LGFCRAFRVKAEPVKLPAEDVVTLKDTFLVSAACIISMLAGGNVVHRIYQPDVTIPVFGDYDEEDEDGE